MIIEGVDMVLHRGTTAIDSFESLFKGPCDTPITLVRNEGIPRGRGEGAQTSMYSEWLWLRVSLLLCRRGVRLHTTHYRRT